MKKFLLITAFTLCTSFLANQAKAGICNLVSCAATITVDSGKTGKRCLTASGSGTGCGCTIPSLTAVSVYTVAASSNCGSDSDAGLKIDGLRCCYEPDPCPLCPRTEAQLAEIEAEMIESSSSGDLSEVFDYDMDGYRADEYYGYVDGASRSPTGGRTTAAKAKLDACLYYSDVNWIETNGGSNNSEKHATCVGNTYGCGTSTKNDHCNATGMNDGVSVTGAVCKDRCDCVYSQGTCAGL